MDSPRTTISLGPLEISIRQRDDNVRLGVLASVVVHVLIVAVLLMAVPRTKTPAELKLAAAAATPVPITFVNPLPPLPKPRAQEIDARKPPPAASRKPLRMQPVPESVASLHPNNKDQAADRAGRHDKNPAGGEAGGPKPVPAPGAPPASDAAIEHTSSDDASAAIEEPKDILGRLREFKKAVEAPRPSTSGPEGGGHGSGGVPMPNLPATGFGIGNLEFEGRDYDWEDYGRQIHGIIWRAWHNRLLITASVFERWAAEHRSWLLEHRNAVRFTILRTGKVVDVAIETESGCYPLDDSATDALKEVVLPPLPPDFQRDSETVHAHFIAEGEIRGMKSFLQQMKNAGFF
jgi:TonB C terminal